MCLKHVEKKESKSDMAAIAPLYDLWMSRFDLDMANFNIQTSFLKWKLLCFDYHSALNSQTENIVWMITNCRLF